MDVLQLKEVEKPTPTDDQLLVEVRAASVSNADLAPVRGALLARLLGTGLLRPKREILGTDIAGRVEAVGKNVKLRPEGSCVVIGGSLGQIFQALLLGPLVSKTGSRKIGFMGIAKQDQNDLVLLGELLYLKPEKSNLSSIDVTRSVRLLRPSSILKKDTPEEK